jgi:hypothetical protein
MNKDLDDIKTVVNDRNFHHMTIMVRASLNSGGRTEAVRYAVQRVCPESIEE